MKKKEMKKVKLKCSYCKKSFMVLEPIAEFYMDGLGAVMCPKCSRAIDRESCIKHNCKRKNNT